MGTSASTIVEQASPANDRALKQFETISEPQLEYIVRLISNAFGNDDPPINGLLGGDMSLKDELFTAMVRATLLEGRVYAIEADRRVVSVALWFRKPMGLFQTDAQRALGFNDLSMKLPQSLQRWWTVDYPKQMQGYEFEIINQEEWDRMWYCSLMATDIEEHNKGHASFLMNKLIEQAQEAGEILGLSTGSETNVGKYKSMGYRERGRIIMHSTVNEFPCIWMTKE